MSKEIQIIESAVPISGEEIEHTILLIRGQKVMLDRDLARLYGVQTKILNKAVSRNLDRFPADFMFQLTPEEHDSLRFQFGTLKRGQHSKYLILKSGMKLCFGSEPDVECRSKAGELVCVIEIKGSADKAGAQTRLGETKKSFTKAKLENPRCHTIFLPSVQTPSVLKQLKTERDIDQVFDLLAILRNKLKRIEFLEELFKFRLREKI